MLWVGLEAFDQILVTQSPVLAQVIRKSLEVVVMFTKTSSVHENQFEGMISLTTVCQEKKKSINQTNKQTKNQSKTKQRPQNFELQSSSCDFISKNHTTTDRIWSKEETCPSS